MPKLAAEIIAKLGSLVHPFQRRNGLNPSSEPMSVDDDAEKKLFSSYNLTSRKIPSDVRMTNEDEPDNYDCYLWVIDNDGIKILWEQTPCESDRGHICHTNITGGELAYHGGELWFVSEEKIILNHDSGRYDHGTQEEKATVKKIFEQLGFSIIRMTERRAGRK